MEHSTTGPIDQPTVDKDSLKIGGGKRVANWTSNLLGTVVVMATALVFGSYLVSNWQFDNEPSPKKTVAQVIGAWPQLESCSLEFGDSPVQIRRELAAGSVDDVLGKLSTDCENVLQSDALPNQPIGPAEKQMIERMKGKTGFREQENWRIYHVAHLPGTGQFPQVIGIRDDCPTHANEPGEANGSWPASRLLVWGIAVPSGQTQWTTYVGSPSLGDSQLGLRDSVIPANARHTMTISDRNLASVIGFSGGTLDETKSFFQSLAEQNQWNIVSPWQQNTNNWSVNFTSAPDSALEGIQVQLDVNHNKSVRGLVTLTAKPGVNQSFPEARE